MWSRAIRTTFLIALPHVAIAAGPAFDCKKIGDDALATIICASPDLSSQNALLSQTYYALRHQVGSAGRDALKKDADDENTLVKQKCEVPTTTPLPAPAQSYVACVQSNVAATRLSWLTRLSGAELEEAQRPIQQMMAAQRALLAQNFLSSGSASDGVFGDSTRAALSAWQAKNGLPGTGVLDDKTATMLLKIPEKLFIARGEADAYVARKSGIGTSAASVQVLLDWAREVRGCTPDDPDQKTSYESCLKYAREHFTGPTVETASANCETGELSSFFGEKPRFYVGRTPEVIDGKTLHDDDGKTLYDDAFDYEGFRVPAAGYTDTFIDGPIFRYLCPNSFHGAPKSNPPELALEINCNESLNSAENSATESGELHVMNVKIVDAWNVQSEGNMWYAATCSAKVMFNTGDKATLKYDLVPMHGKYFLQTRIEP